MKFKCCVLQCTSVYTSSNEHNISFFKIANDRKAEWSTKIGRPELIETAHSNTRICSLHFEECFFKNKAKNRLRSNAVPTLLLENASTCQNVDIQPNYSSSSLDEFAVAEREVTSTTGNGIKREILREHKEVKVKIPKIGRPLGLLNDVLLAENPTDEDIITNILNFEEAQEDVMNESSSSDGEIMSIPTINETDRAVEDSFSTALEKLLEGTYSKKETPVN